MQKLMPHLSRFFDSSSETLRATSAVMTQVFRSRPFNTIGLSLNGGKDSTAVLFLTLYFMELFSNGSNTFPPLKCIYIKEKEPFPEILQYLEDAKASLNIDLVSYENTQHISQNFMKESLRDFIGKTGVELIILGTRSTDPFAQNLQMLQSTDEHQGWPRFDRLLPIYFWDYALIWRFIREAQLPYCALYDRGFTYVGDRINSVPNHFLGGKHAAAGNDNLELFSRKKIIDDLARVGDLILLQKDKCFILVTGNSANCKSLNQADFDKMEIVLRDFCAKRKLAFTFDLKTVDVFRRENAKGNSADSFIEVVLENKRQPDNSFFLYMGIVVDSETGQISAHI